MDNFDHWMSIYQKSRENRPKTLAHSYKPNDYNIFPRYQANEALLQGVEEIEPEKCCSVDDLKKQIIESALKSQTVFTRDVHETAKNAIEDERNKFKAFVESISEQDLLDVSDLFYRRKLSDIETSKWKSRLKLHSIDFSGFWFPKNDISENEREFLVFDEDAVSKELEIGINEIVEEYVKDKYFVFNEDNVNYELEKDTFDIFNLSPEAYLFDSGLSWLIYYSHEDFYIIKSRQIADRLKSDFTVLNKSMNQMMHNGR